MKQCFSQESIDFLWGIRFNNERSWFQPRKEEFRELVEIPLRELAAEVTLAMQEEFPELGLESKVSRIYRDARRLYGRGPYKDHMWFSLRRPHDPGFSVPGFYFEIAPEYYGFGMGCYDPTPVTMAKLRARIDRNPGPIEELARRLEEHGDFRLDGQEYKRPKGDPGVLLSPWYNRKSIGFSCEYNCEGTLFTPELTQQVLEGFRFMVPFYEFLRDLAADAPPEHP